MRSTIRGARVAGIAAAVPAQRQAVLDTRYGTEAERRKFSETTGIQERRLVKPGQCTSDLAAAAAERLLDELAWERDTLDLLVLVTQTPDYALPATAVTLQDRLGLPKGCAAWDVNLGCSGYTYGLATMAGLIAGMGVKRGLLLVGDTAAQGVPPSAEPATPPLFGDAATATALESSESAPAIYADLQSDGSGAEIIMQRMGGARNPHRPDTFHYEITDDGIIALDNGYQLDGVEVFNFSMREVPAAVKNLLAYAAMPPEDVDAFVFHQANKLINDLLRKQLRLPLEKFPTTLPRYANTSSATIPLTIVSELRERLRSREMKLLLCGFGVGLSWATVLCRTDRIACPEVIEL
jgi:3-oxoacyl-[acyl-carrier-protein] synthase-3